MYGMDENVYDKILQERDDNPHVYRYGPKTTGGVDPIQASIEAYSRMGHRRVVSVVPKPSHLTRNVLLLIAFYWIGWIAAISTMMYSPGSTDGSFGDAVAIGLIAGTACAGISGPFVFLFGWAMWEMIISDIIGTVRHGQSYGVRPGWVDHMNCGDWLHGGVCPDPSWHGPGYVNHIPAGDTSGAADGSGL